MLLFLFVFFPEVFKFRSADILEKNVDSSSSGLEKMLNFASNSRSPCPYFYVFGENSFFRRCLFSLYTLQEAQQLNKFFRIFFFIESAVELGRKFPVVINNGAYTHTFILTKTLIQRLQLTN